MRKSRLPKLLIYHDILVQFSSSRRVDEQIPFMSNILLAQTFGLTGALTVISITMPLFLILLVPLGLIYYQLQK